MSILPLLTKNNASAVEKRLSPHSAWILKVDQRGKKISSLKGTLWVTQSSDPKDYLLHSGESFVITRRGAVVVEGISESVLRVGSIA